jgi:vibriolysin
VTTKKLVRGLGLGWLVLIGAASCVATEDPTTDGEDTASGAERSGDDIQQALEALPSASVVDVDDSGVPTFITGRLGKVTSLVGGTPDIKPIVSQVAKVFRANADDLSLRTTVTSGPGDEHFRLAQTKNGLPVLGGELIIHVQNGLVTGANGNARHDLQTPAADSAKLDGKAAIVAATSVMDDVKGLAASGEPTLAYRPSGTKLELVYVVRATGEKTDGTPVVDDVIVNASTGAVLDRIGHIHTARNREVHNLNHGTSLPGPIARTETGPANADAVVNNNFDRLGTTYDTYKVLFNRDSFDNAGAKLISSVHYSNNYVNAFWDGTQMVYGDGDNVNASNLANSLDVTAHELTHAVTERTSNLTYSGQSGGLNEGMSDIFGNVVEWFRDNGNNPNATALLSANNVMVGEDIWTPATPNDALRYMNDPKKDGSSIDFAPDFFSGIDVHYSSGVPNLAFVLLANGGQHPRGKTTNVVTGIGVVKAAQVFYRANTSIFTASTNYAAAKTGCEQAAVQLGLSAAEQASVTAAWQAVGVGTVTPPPPPPPGGGVLTNNVPVTGLSAAKGVSTAFTLAVTAGATGLKFQISGGTGDADLYVKFGTAPTDTSFDCRPFLNGNNETCNVATAKVGTYHVRLKAFAAYSGVTLKGSFTGGAPPPPTGCAHDECVVGVSLVSGCSAVATAVCAADSFCCSSTGSWDSLCVGETTSIGGKACP